MQSFFFLSYTTEKNAVQQSYNKYCSISKKMNCDFKYISLVPLNMFFSKYSALAPVLKIKELYAT